MSVRIISGAARGRRLKVPANGTRPTSGVVRGALLTMLEHRGWLADARLLDLFAGSGALGIEALSRGARAAVFVDEAAGAVRVLRQNLAISKLGDRTEVVALPALAALRRLARRGDRFDGVLADPPYGNGWVQRTVDAVVEQDLLAPGGWIAVEHRADEAPQAVGDLQVHVSRRHGNTTVTLLERSGGEA